MENKRIDDIVNDIANMRNKRIESTKIIHGIDNIIYHCVAREEE